MKSEQIQGLSLKIFVPLCNPYQYSIPLKYNHASDGLEQNRCCLSFIRSRFDGFTFSIAQKTDTTLRKLCETN